MDLESLALLAGEECCSLIVADDLLGLRIPLDGPLQTRGDGGQVARVQRLNVTEYVRNRQTAFGDTAVEVILMAFGRLAFIQGVAIFGLVLAFVPILFDRCAGDLATADKDAALGALEQNAVVAPAVEDGEAFGDSSRCGEARTRLNFALFFSFAKNRPTVSCRSTGYPPILQRDS